jgi:hypothetical protein
VKPSKAVEAVVGALSDDLRRDPWKSDPNILAGQCYVAVEALFHLLGGEKGLWRPMYVTVLGEPHWFLKNLMSGEILDPTREQFVVEPSYAEAVPKGFLTGYAKPSERAQELVRRARRTLKN